MAKSDLFKRSLEAGTTFLGVTRERAEAVVKEWVEAGDLGTGRAKKAVEEVLERSRRITDELQELIRREIAAQLAAIGVATRADVARLEAKIDAATAPAAAPSAGGPVPSSAATPPRRRSSGAPVTKAASTKPRGPATKKAPRSSSPPSDGGRGAGGGGGGGEAPGPPT